MSAAHLVAATRTIRVAIAVCVFVAPLIQAEFPSLELIKDPGDRNVVNASEFSDRNQWVFPFLSFHQRTNITSWVFRATPEINWDKVPSFLLWKENVVTPNTVDYLISSNSMGGQVEQVYPSNPSLFQLILDTPLLVEEGNVLGVMLPPAGNTSLTLIFLVNSEQGDYSYYTKNRGSFLSASNAKRDDTHIPLVSPILALPVDITSLQSSSNPTSSVDAWTYAVTYTSSIESTTIPASPRPSSFPPDSASSAPPLIIIIASAAAVAVVIILTLSLIAMVVFIKCKRPRVGGGIMANPIYQVPENGAGTGKSTSSNGSYHAYAIPTPSRFISATLPPLPSHCMTRLPTPLFQQQHYEFASTLEDSLRSHLYDLPNKAATMPLPYEVPMAPFRKRHHAYSELECGDFPTASSDSDQQEDKKGDISASSSQLFDNAIYRVHPKSEQSSRVEGQVTDDLYWQPASSSTLLYDQLSKRKFKEILREKIRTTEHLGSGHFGTVDKGVWQSPDGPVGVAVKQLQLRASEEDRVKFLQEAAIMGQFFHPNVVKLHGVVTKEDPIIIILEYMPNGDLRNRLLNINPVESNGITLPCKLLMFCQEVASGMQYLSKKAFVHRDLAARNILLDSADTCKIGDFGMSRNLQDSDYYITHGGKIPVKWTAPEALHFKKYSTPSDVWSFGCLMYEIWSLGHKPFEDYSNLECIHMISNGYRLPPPPGISRSLYHLLISCWHKQPSQRPTFTGVLSALSDVKCQLQRDDAEHLFCELGKPIEEGAELYPDLQNCYIEREEEEEGTEGGKEADAEEEKE